MKYNFLYFKYWDVFHSNFQPFLCIFGRKTEEFDFSFKRSISLIFVEGYKRENETSEQEDCWHSIIVIKNGVIIKISSTMNIDNIVDKRQTELLNKCNTDESLLFCYIFQED